MRTCALVLLCACAGSALAAQRVPRLVNTGGVEAEAFLGAATATQGAVIRQDMAGFGAAWSGGAQLMWQAAGAGATLRLVLPSSGTGPHQVILWFTRAPDYGRFTFAVEGAAPVTLDGYAPAVMRDSALIGAAQLGTQPIVIRVQVVGKSPQSHGYFVGLDRFSFPAQTGVPTAALRTVAPAEPSTASTEQGIQNIANARARNQNLTNAPSLTQTIANVPVVRAGAGAEALADAPLFTQGLIGNAAFTPLSSEQKLTIARNALGGLSGGTQSLMSLGGLQADEGAVVRLTAGAPWVQGRALLITKVATSYPQGPLYEFWLKGAQPSDQEVPGFRLDLNPNPAVKAYIVDCDVSVSSTAIFRSVGQDVTLHAGSHHYTAIVEAHPKGWSELAVTLLPVAPVPSGALPPKVSIRSCEVTPLQ